MLQKISINKCCSFELAIYHRISWAPNHHIRKCKCKLIIDHQYYLIMMISEGSRDTEDLTIF